jgi:N-acetyl-anhydromuramyl-L-alanine amidase AmpD
MRRALFTIQTALLLTTLSNGVLAQDGPLKIVDHLMSEKVSRPRGNRPVEYVMLHFSSDVVAHPEAPYDLDRVIATYGNAASANYLIDRDGNVFCLVKENRVAWHAGKGALPWPPYLTNNLNSYSIGIEMMNVSTWQDMKIFMPKATYDKVAKKDIGYTDAQYKSLNLLLAGIRGRWPQVKMDRHHIVAHSTYAPGRRSDPGELFDWTRIGLPAELPTN